MAAEHGATIVWNVDPSVPRVTADPHKLLQVLLNLVKNSVRALENAEQRTIEISAIRDGASVYVSVQDSGGGVDDPAGLFQPFRSASGSTGLGLYISRAVVRSFGGDVVYEPVRQGARFAIRLPVAAS